MSLGCAAANDWGAPQSFRHHLTYAKYVDEVYTTLRNGVLTRHIPGGPRKTTIAPGDIPAVLAARTAVLRSALAADGYPGAAPAPSC